VDVSNFAVLNADVSTLKGQIADVPASGFLSSPLSTAELEGLIGKVFNLSFERLAMLPSRHSYELVLVRRDIKQIVGAMRLHDIRPEGDLSYFEAARMLVMKQNRFKAFLALRPNFRVLKIDYDELYTTPDIVLPKIAKFFERHYTLDVGAMRRALGASQGMPAQPITDWLVRKLDALRAESF
jgi:hypothetical protein